MALRHGRWCVAVAIWLCAGAATAVGAWKPGPREAECRAALEAALPTPQLEQLLGRKLTAGLIAATKECGFAYSYAQPAPGELQTNLVLLSFLPRGQARTQFDKDRELLGAQAVPHAPLTGMAQGYSYQLYNFQMLELLTTDGAWMQVGIDSRLPAGTLDAVVSLAVTLTAAPVAGDWLMQD
jgi:hypothetical protein